VALTSDALDAAVLRRCMWPAVNAPLTLVERLAIADEEIAGTLYPEVMRHHAGYYLTVEDTALVAGTARYRLPARTFGPLQSVVLVGADAAELGTLPQVNPQDTAAYARGSSAAAYYVDGDYLVLVPTPVDAGQSLRVRYYRRPNALCGLADARVIASTGASSYVATAALPAEWTTGTLLDVVNAGDASSVVDSAAPIASVSTPTIALGRAASAYALPGDYLSIAETTPVVQLPGYLHQAAIRYVAAACLYAHGDREAGGIEFGHAERLADLALRVGVPRVQSEPRPVVTRNSPYRGQGW
jgi:hypothetical protein